MEATFDCDSCGACGKTLPIFAADRESRIRRESLPLADHVAKPDYCHRLFPLPFHETCCFLDEESRCTITPPDRTSAGGLPPGASNARRRGPASGCRGSRRV
jgi:hypothetical protein